ncbi:hypothetical protein REPUB_Repub05bG0130200 [Reevesia pubescens]
MVVATFSFCNVANLFMSEAIAVFKALVLAQELRFTHILLKGDSLAIINRLFSAIADMTPIGHIVEETRAMPRVFTKIGILHTGRKRNMATHVVAKFALDQDGDKVWIEEHLSFLDSALQNDYVSQDGCIPI